MARDGLRQVQRRPEEVDGTGLPVVLHNDRHGRTLLHRKRIARRRNQRRHFGPAKSVSEVLWHFARMALLLRRGRDAQSGLIAEVLFRWEQGHGVGREERASSHQEPVLPCSGGSPTMEKAPSAPEMA